MALKQTKTAPIDSLFYAIYGRDAVRRKRNVLYSKEEKNRGDPKQ